MPGLSTAFRRGPPALSETWRSTRGDWVVGVVPVVGRVVVARVDGRVEWLDADSGTSFRAVEAHAIGLNAVSASSDGLAVATAGQDGRVRIFNADAADLATIDAPRKWIEALQFAPDGRCVAFATGNRLRVHTLDGGLRFESAPAPATVTDLAWSPGGDTLATATYGGLHLYGLGGDLRVLEWKGSLVSAAWSPNGEVVACGSQDCSVHFWRLKSGRDAEMRGYPSKPRALAWSPDSRLLFTSGSPNVCIWEFSGSGPEGTAPLELEGHAATLTALSHARTGQLLASGDQAGEVRVWRVGRGRKPSYAGRVEGEVTSLAWLADPARLVVGASSGEVALFRVD